MIKIIAGKYKRSNLIVPENNVRPTSALKKEAIFSIIESYALKNSIDLYKNKAVMDIFAGSGSVGLEAISRGMKEAYFYENNSKVLEILKKNCLKICKSNNYKIIEKDVMIFSPKKIFLPVSLIFIDPPYFQYDVSKLLIKLLRNDIIKKNTIVVVETNIKDKLEVQKQLKIFDQRSYGVTLLYFLKTLI